MANEKRRSLDYTWNSQQPDLLTVTERADAAGKFEKGSSAQTRSFNFAEVPEKLTPKFLEIGRRTKLGNFAVDASTVAEKFAAMDEGFALLVSGEWESERAGGGPTVSPEIEAIANLKKVSVAQAQKAYRALKEESPEKAEALLKGKQVSEEAARIRKARETSGEIDLTSLM